MTIAKMLAIRRDLESGFNAFKQVGNVVYHTLDNVNWVKAFVLPDTYGESKVTQSSTLTFKQLWRAIRTGDTNGQKPEKTYSEVAKLGKQKSMASCYAVRGIVHGYFAGFYQQFAKEYHINKAASVTEETVKSFFVNALAINEYVENSPLQFIGDVSVFLAGTLANYADEFALFFDEEFYQLTAQFWAEIFDFDYSPKSPVLDALACDIITAIGTDESYANFKTVSGTALPPLVTDADIVYQAWEEFASREIWQAYLLLSRTAPLDYSSCPCGETCYSVPPSACIPLTSQGQPFLSCVGEGDYLKNVVWSGTYQNRLEFQTFYPLGIETPKKIASIHVTFDTNGVYDTGTASPQILCYLQDTYGNWSNPDIPGFPFEGYGKRWVSAGNFEYSFATAPNNNTLYQSIRFRCDASYIINDAANHAAVKAYVKSVIVCTKE